MKSSISCCVLVIAACQISICLGASAVYGTCERQMIPVELDTNCVNVTCTDHGEDKPMDLHVELCPMVFCEKDVKSGEPGDTMKIFPECCPNPNCQP